jgi:hypothetical protein
MSLCFKLGVARLRYKRGVRLWVYLHYRRGGNYRACYRTVSLTRNSLMIAVKRAYQWWLPPCMAALLILAPCVLP